MAKVLLILSIPALFALTYFSGIEKGLYPVAFSFSFLPLCIASLLYSLSFTYVISAMGCLMLIFYMLCANLAPIPLIPLFLAFFAAPWIIELIKNIFRTEAFSLVKNVSKEGIYLKTLDTKKAQSDRRIEELDKRTAELAGLYEATRAMGPALRFEKIAEVISRFLGKMLTSGRCKLILADAENSREIWQAYRLSDGGRKIEPDDHDRRIFAAMHENKKMINLGYSSLAGGPTNEALLPREAATFLAIPLMSQQQMIGILTAEDLERDDFEKFLVIANQFALEIEKVRLYETVAKLAIIDGLTRVFVRRHFMERFDEELQRSEKHGFELSFLMVDLDKFKSCNDRYGHLVGDAVLRYVANILKKTLREIDLIARYGGEEFCVLLPETNKHGAVFVAERLRNFVASNKIKAYDEEVGMTISVGVATFPHDANTAKDLIERADEALYKAKAEGRNRVVDYSPGTDKREL